MWSCSVSPIIGISGTVAGCIAMLSSCASMDQKQSDVYRREAGGRLQPWKTVQEASEIHWPYAWAAVASYQDSDDPKRTPLKTSAECPDPHVFLAQRGWVQWTELPSLKPRKGERYADAAQRMRDVHLRAEVWSNATTRQVVVAFGGTAASSWYDWKSNLRWVLFFDTHDEYTVLTDSFLPAFVKEYQRQEDDPEGTWLKDARVIATGHSLGGGLAQRFTYSLQAKSGIPIVKEVYAFDPSPVSGKRGSPDFAEQARGLTIYRIYNRGEILASLRSLVHFGNPGDRRNQGQTWIDIRYRDNWTWRTLLPSGSVHAHGMWDLARFMAKNLPPADMPACLNSADN
jgi:Lipase (class 3)